MLHPHAPRTARPQLLAALVSLVSLTALGACSSEEEPTKGAPPSPPVPVYVPPPEFALEVDPTWFERPPGERAAVGGLEGFHAVSAIEFPERKNIPHRFDMVYVFPDRARWAISEHFEPQKGFILDYQFGGHRYRKMPDSPTSTELFGPSLAGGMRQMKLRLALMMYPDGLEWGAEETEGDIVTRVANLDEAGAIRATLGKDGQPSSFTAIAPDGTDQETFYIDSWRNADGRAWPFELRLEDNQGKLIWREQVKNLSTQLNLKDRYFIPVDFKELPVGQSNLGEEPRMGSIPPMSVRREALGESAGWEAALSAEAAARATLAGGAAQLHEFISFELDDSARPQGFFIRLEPGSPAADGFDELPVRQAVLLFANSLDEVGPEHLERLRAALPPGAEAGTPYVTWPTSIESTRVQVLLPYNL